MNPTWDILQGDCIEVIRGMEPESVHCVVTSPPYFGLRSYGHWVMQAVWGDLSHFPESRRYRGPLHVFWLRWRAAERGGVFCRYRCCWIGCLGLEPTLDLYIQHMGKVFREVRRVLRKDGTLWLNLGDAYAASHTYYARDSMLGNARAHDLRPTVPMGLKPKDLIGLPWRVAFALQADGWWLRSDIIWEKKNPMPESVRDRPTRAHEYVFLMTKSAKYFYDSDAIREPMAESSIARISQESFWEQTGGEKDYRNGLNPNRSARGTLENLARRTPAGWNVNHDESNQKGLYPQKADKQRGHSRRHAGFNDRWDGMSKEEQQAMGANKRTVWSIATQPYKGSHFATFPEALVRPCILAGTSEHGVCGVTGDPWARVVEVSDPASRLGDSWHDHKDDIGRGQRGVPRAKDAPIRSTTGWQPTCDHDAEPVPATVLDPFCGSGTTGVVVLRHGRSFIGIELNAEYIELARERIIDDAPLLNSVADAWARGVL